HPLADHRRMLPLEKKGSLVRAHRVYRAYQEEMRRLQVYDRPGTLWAALEQLESCQYRPFENTRLVIADGFSDFTTVEARMLATLARIAGRCLVTLTMVPEDDGDRPELLRIPRRSLQMLERTFSGANISTHRLGPLSDASTDLRYLVGQLFNPMAGPRQPEHNPSPDGTVQILEAPGIWAEVRMVAREIKRLLTKGDGRHRVSPAQIGVVARTLEQYETALREVFAEYGLPLTLVRGQRLADSAVARPVLGLLRALVNDFPRADTLELWRSTYIDLAAVAGKDYAPPEDAEEITATADIVGGRERWLHALDQLVERTQKQLAVGERKEEASEDEDRVSQAELCWTLDVAQRVKATFRALASLLEPLVGESSRAEKIERFVQILDQLRIADRLVGPDRQATAADLRAWNSILATLSALSDIDRFCSGETARAITLEQFASEVEQALASTSLPAEGRGEGCIAAMAVGDALQMSFDYVFLIGLTEGSFPLVRSADPLVPEECRRELEQLGAPIRSRLAAADEEAYLFHLALGMAKQRLYLSYPTVDAKGDALLRSMYVDEVVRLLPHAPVRRLELRDVIPPLWDVGCGREMAERVLWLEHNGGPENADQALYQEAAAILARREPWADAFNQARLGARVERLRDGRLADVHTGNIGVAPLGPFDGVLTDREAVSLVATRFGENHVFSASQLSEYGTCPMRFFFSRILRLPEPAEPQEEVTRLDMGKLLHRILRRFYEARLAAGLGHVADGLTEEKSPEELERHLQEPEKVLMETAERVFEDYEAQELTGRAKLFAVVKDCLRARLRGWLLAETEARKRLKIQDGLALRPAHLEFEYSPDNGTALSLELPVSGTVVFSGRIDRIDEVGDDGFVVYDYKLSGGAPISDMRQGRDFQLVLYALAAEKVVYEEQRKCMAWAYVAVGPPSKGAYSGVASDRRTLEEVVQAALDHADAHIASIRAGRFHWPSKCDNGSRCPFSAVCRYSNERARLRVPDRDSEGEN
ncbi:MAG: PD-(D/E)XK nuclease family protein, partial [Armatimonadetes bacterium]|nr:PD-(D/E)XK nuclease family protein [Armatimonadota bacterium]